MLVAVLVLNIIVLGPVLIGITSGSVGMDAAFGVDTVARRILASVYASIAIVSFGLIGLHVFAHPWAVQMTLALFAVQIMYKLLSARVVGVSNPVVITNLAIVLVQLVAIVLVWRAGLLSA